MAPGPTYWSRPGQCTRLWRARTATRPREAFVVGLGPAVDHFHPVCCQHLQRRPLRWSRCRVRILSHVERSINPLRFPVIANRLRDRQDVRLGERAIERRATMPAGAEAYELIPIGKVRAAIVIRALELAWIDQQFFWSALARERRNRRRLPHVMNHRGLHHEIGHDLRCQMSAAYSAIVRSLENFPEPATLRMALRAQALGSAYSALRRPSASR